MSKTRTEYMEFGDLSEDMLGEAPGGGGLLSRLAEYGRTRRDYFDMEQVTRIILLPQLILEFSACLAAEILRQKSLPCDSKAAAFFLVSQQQSCA